MRDARRDLSRRSVLKGVAAGALGGAGVLGSSGSALADESEDHYHNPTGPFGFGDTTVVQTDDGTYYVYGTETPEDVVPIARSENLVDWTYVGAALESKPDWRDNPDAGVWAPDINYYDGQYHLYYSYSTWGSQNNPGIGLATADTPEGPFTDQGPVFRANDLSMTNAIDSEFVRVDGTPYMVGELVRALRRRTDPRRTGLRAGDDLPPRGRPSRGRDDRPGERLLLPVLLDRRLL